MSSFAVRAVAALSLGLFAVRARAEIPSGWFFEGARREGFVVSLDREKPRQGSFSARVAKTLPGPEYGGLLQTIRADRFRGKRIRLVGWIKTEKLAAWGGLFMRIEGTSARDTLAFDNMQRRPVRGTTPWTQYSVVLDVPVEARRIHFGAGLSGQGALWVDDLSLSVVGMDVAVTEAHSTPVGPSNTGFEE